LIASGLLRIRLELCVVESFFNEAVGPFIKQNGLSWILPFHETVETFIAGTIFALAATFILIGSTKIITVLVTYTDLVIGIPFRLFGGFINDRALGKPVTLDIGFGPFKTRVVGPPDDPQEKKVDVTKLDPVTLVVVGLSGAVRVTGQAVGVSISLIVIVSYIKFSILLFAAMHLFNPSSYLPFVIVVSIAATPKSFRRL
jgi:hypothetical protein